MGKSTEEEHESAFKNAVCKACRITMKSAVCSYKHVFKGVSVTGRDFFLSNEGVQSLDVFTKMSVL